MHTDFRRVLIVNRGEPAMRVIHAIREFNLEHGTDIAAIALFTEPDRQARFVREASETFDLGPATFVDERDGQRKASYLDYDRLEHAITECRADAVWAGWGFVAERPDFVELCDRLGVAFIGPDSGAMRRVGDKITAKRLAEHLGIPVVPWGGEAATTVELARSHANRLGYPVAIKATAGAGGRGIRKVMSEMDLETAFRGATQEAGRTFGDPTVFIERWLTGARHIEVQIQADRHGTMWTVGLRDCSVQRRYQKLISEAPARGLSVSQEQGMRNAATRLCQAAEYRDAATVEFLFEPVRQQFALMEVNPRLQVEHLVTELTTGVDLVKLQLFVARGGQLDKNPPSSTGHAIDVRLNAEDPEAGFTAAPGVIEVLRLPTGPGLRVDSGVSEGDRIPPEYGSMFAKLAAHGATRDEALGRLQFALADSAVVIRGGTTNRAFLQQLLDRPEIRGGTIDVDWLDRVTARGDHMSLENASIALLAAAIEVYEAELAAEQERFLATALRARPVVRSEIGRQVEVGYRGHHYQFRVCEQSPQDYRVDVDGSRFDLQVDRVTGHERWLTVGGRRCHTLAASQGYSYQVEVDGILHRVSRADAGIVRAPAPAMVVSLSLEAGDRVAAGDRLAVLEAMKMEMPVLAPFSGTVRQVMVTNNSQVSAGAPIVHLEPSAEDSARTVGPRVTFEGASRGSDKPVSRTRAILHGVRAGFGELKRSAGAGRLPGILQGFKRLALGFDVDSADARRLVVDYTRICSSVAADDEDLLRGEDEVLDIFVDIASVFATQVGVESRDGEPDLSAQQYLFAFLRSPGTYADLPAWFLSRLQRAVRHHGVSDMADTQALGGGLLWMFKAYHRVDQQIPAIGAILERRLAAAAKLAPGSDRFIEVLDCLIRGDQVRFPAVADLAREVRYRYSERPAFERARAATYTQVQAEIEQLARFRGAPERDARVAALVNSPQPLRGPLSARLEDSPPAVRELILEVMTRRYYRIRKLENVRTADVENRSVVFAEYEHEGRLLHVVATHARTTDFAAALQTVRPIVAGIAPTDDVVLELYLWLPGPLGDSEGASEQFRQALGAAGFDRQIRRAVCIVAGPSEASSAAGMQFFTFRPREHEYREERLYRGLHPLMGKRLQLWRLRNFFVDRLPSVEDVYLFRGVARENPKDERLFAIVEVRDVTPVRDAAGRIAKIPHLEWMLMEALLAIRRAQLTRAPEERLHWNRVVMYVRQPLMVDRADLEVLARSLGAQIEGLGIEKFVVCARMPGEDGEMRDTVIRVRSLPGRGVSVQFSEPAYQPIRPLTDYAQKVLRMRQRGLPYPYEVIRMLTPDGADPHADLPPGRFVEYDLDEQNRIVPVDRPHGKNTANIVIGVIENITPKYPEGMKRVILLGDPSKEMGSLAESECRRIIAGLDLAEQMKVPLEWFALSAGAKISMESGTENMDWIARVLRRLIEYTQAGCEVNIIVVGINVGAQPYWNAEATMLMHTRGILVMTPEGAMVLTGKTALDYSGSVSAEDNLGIGGYEHIMGPNGQAQYWARDVAEACTILLRHYDHTYIAPGERFPRRAVTTDAIGRDICAYPHNGGEEEFRLVGDIFSDEKNPGRKKPFDIRKVMRSVTDQDHQPLERWPAMRDAENAVIWDAHIGGYPVAMIGLESRALPRRGWVPADGPEQWTSGTLFPMASKKVARAVNAATDNRPLVVLANLSGFDGAPESMRRRQLEFGAEIGRAVTNFKGPIIFVVISRYHGGAFVVFSRTLNENLEVAALEGSFASVIGGAPAAAVVFAREVDTRTRKDPRLQALEKEIAAAPEAEKSRTRAKYADAYKTIRSEKLGQVAEEFDHIHSVHRALKVGSLHRIIRAADLRPYLVDAIERGTAREFERLAREGVLPADGARL